MHRCHDGRITCVHTLSMLFVMSVVPDHRPSLTTHLEVCVCMGVQIQCGLDGVPVAALHEWQHNLDH
jgi:hypothetical protein